MGINKSTIILFLSILLGLTSYSESPVVEFVAQVVVFPKQKIDQLVAQDLTKPLDIKTLSSLLKQGVGRIIISPRLVTCSGSEASIYDEQTQQFIQNMQHTESSVAKKKTNLSEKSGETNVSRVGYSFYVMVVVAEDRKSADLEFKFKITESLICPNGETSNEPAKGDQPALRAEKLLLKEYEISEMFTIQNGETKIVASATTSKADEVVFIFLTSTIEEVL